MKKLKIVGIKKEEERSYFIFKKEQSFFSMFPKFLDSLGIDMSDYAQYTEYRDNPPKISEIKNSIDDFTSKDYIIDVIYTHDRIILIVRTRTEKAREKLMSEINKIAEFKVIKKK